MELFCDAHKTAERFRSHVGELQRLLVFHGLRYGLPESFGSLGQKLTESKAFRTDMSAMARGVRDQEQGDISSEEMLTLVGLAAGGEELVDGRSPVMGVGNTVGVLRVLLDAVGGWRDSADGSTGRVDEGVAGARGGTDVATGASAEAGVAEGGAVAARGVQRASRFGDMMEMSGVREEPVAALIGEEPERRTPEVEDTGAAPPELVAGGVIAGSQDRVELAIRELKVYLDDIDRRISRLEPHVEDLSQTLRGAGRRQAESGDGPGTEVPDRDAPWTVPEAVSWEMGHAASGAAEAGNGTSAGGHEAANGYSGGRSWAALDALRERSPDQTRDWDQEKDRAVTATEHTGEVRGSAPDALWKGSAGEGLDEIETETAGVGVPLVTRAAEPERGRRLPLEWRHRAGVWMAGVALVFGILGIAGLARLWPPLGGQSAAATPAKSAAAMTGAAHTGAAGGASVPVAKAPAAAAPESETVSAGEVERTRERDSAATAAGLGTMALPGTEPKPAAVRKAVTVAETKASKTPEKGSSAHAAAAPVKTPEKSAAAPSVVMASVPVANAAMPLPGTVPARASTGDGRPKVEVSSAGNKVVSSKTPLYPADALRAHTEATVVLNAFLSKDGTVRRMDVVQGAYGFNRSAMDAIWQWRFRPEMEHGQPVEGKTQITVNYRLR